jgi:hypothetical protein
MEEWLEGQNLAIYLVGWAGDLVLCAENEADLHKMWEILSDELAKVTLTWKPGSMEIVVAGSPSAGASPCVWWSGSISYSIPLRDHIVFLGAFLRWDGDPVAIANHRIAQAWVHFWSRQRVLCCRRIPLIKRWLKSVSIAKWGQCIAP